MMKRPLSCSYEISPGRRRGKCLPAGYKASSRALNSGELHRAAQSPAREPQLSIPELQLRELGHILHPALHTDGLGTRLTPAQGRGLAGQARVGHVLQTKN